MTIRYPRLFGCALVLATLLFDFVSLAAIFGLAEIPRGWELPRLASPDVPFMPLAGLSPVISWTLIGFQKPDNIVTYIWLGWWINITAQMYFLSLYQQGRLK